LHSDWERLQHLVGVGHERDGDTAALGGGDGHFGRPLDLGQQHRKRRGGGLVQPETPRLHTTRVRPRLVLRVKVTAGLGL